MAPDAQASFISKNIKDFGVTEAGEDELIEAVDVIRMHQNTWASVNKAKKLIKDAMPMIEEPTRIRIGDVAEVECTIQTMNRQSAPEKSITVRRKTLKLL